ncbi:MAG TPA: hypothetical protein PK856_00710, partial [Vitreoscilla sp.]|nr:hypothetical protein [Vitreoscilla sp.]
GDGIEPKRRLKAIGSAFAVAEPSRLKNGCGKGLGTKGLGIVYCRLNIIPHNRLIFFFVIDCHHRINLTDI